MTPEQLQIVTDVQGAAQLDVLRKMVEVSKDRVLALSEAMEKLEASGHTSGRTYQIASERLAKYAQFISDSNNALKGHADAQKAAAQAAKEAAKAAQEAADAAEKQKKANDELLKTIKDNQTSSGGQGLLSRLLYGDKSQAALNKINAAAMLADLRKEAHDTVEKIQSLQKEMDRLAASGAKGSPQYAAAQKAQKNLAQNLVAMNKEAGDLEGSQGLGGGVRGNLAMGHLIDHLRAFQAGGGGLAGLESVLMSGMRLLPQFAAVTGGMALLWNQYRERIIEGIRRPASIRSLEGVSADLEYYKNKEVKFTGDYGTIAALERERTGLAAGESEHRRFETEQSQAERRVGEVAQQAARYGIRAPQGGPGAQQIQQQMALGAEGRSQELKDEKEWESYIKKGERLSKSTPFGWLPGSQLVFHELKRQSAGKQDDAKHQAIAEAEQEYNKLFAAMRDGTRQEQAEAARNLIAKARGVGPEGQAIISYAQGVLARAEVAQPEWERQESFRAPVGGAGLETYRAAQTKKRQLEAAYARAKVESKGNLTDPELIATREALLAQSPELRLQMETSRGGAEFEEKHGQINIGREAELRQYNLTQEVNAARDSKNEELARAKEKEREDTFLADKEAALDRQRTQAKEDIAHEVTRQRVGAMELTREQHQELEQLKYNLSEAKSTNRFADIDDARKKLMAKEAELGDKFEETVGARIDSESSYSQARERFHASMATMGEEQQRKAKALLSKIETEVAMAEKAGRGAEARAKATEDINSALDPNWRTAAHRTQAQVQMFGASVLSAPGLGQNHALYGTEWGRGSLSAAIYQRRQRGEKPEESRKALVAQIKNKLGVTDQAAEQIYDQGANQVEDYETEMSFARAMYGPLADPRVFQLAAEHGKLGRWGQMIAAQNNPRKGTLAYNEMHAGERQYMQMMARQQRFNARFADEVQAVTGGVRGPEDPVKKAVDATEENTKSLKELTKRLEKPLVAGMG